MFNPRLIPVLPAKLTKMGIFDALAQSIGTLRFGRNVAGYAALLRLYQRTFDLELAISPDLCVVPPGWIENHRVLLPGVFRPVTEGQIRKRLERMLHAPGDREAMEAILAAASYVTNKTSDGTKKRRRLILSVPDLAERLARARTLDPGYVDALLRGRLGLCAKAIARGCLRDLQRDSAVELLLTMARLWGLHDLQIIASKLHQALYRPTAGLFEGTDAGPQSFQSVMRDPAKMAEMANIASQQLRLRHDQITPTDLENRRRLYGFVTGTDFKAFAREIGLKMGFTADDLVKIENDELANNPKLAKVLRNFSLAAEVAGDEIATDIKLKWDDRAPVGASKPRSISHSSAAVVRYGLDETAALAAITAFIDLSAHLPEMIERHIAQEPVAATPHRMGLDVRNGDNRVTFERMFAAYRMIFLRDPNCLRDDVVEFMQTKIKFNVFASKKALKAVRQDFIFGVTATVGERLGETNPLNPPDGTEPGNETRYGADSLQKALAVLKRDHDDCRHVYNPELTPAVAWRLSR